MLLRESSKIKLAYFGHASNHVLATEFAKLACRQWLWSKVGIALVNSIFFGSGLTLSYDSYLVTIYDMLMFLPSCVCGLYENYLLLRSHHLSGKLCLDCLGKRS